MRQAGRLFLGLISGTSFDAIDAAVISLASDGSVQAIGGVESPIQGTLRSAIARLRQPAIELDQLAQVDSQLGEAFAETALACLDRLDLRAADLTAVGSHGQTLWHRPQSPGSNTLQIGNPAIIAERLGCRVVADFRRADMAAGGQGAPLVPPFHKVLFSRPGHDRAVLNLGGIANLTLLPGATDRPVTGFDTGPANGLLDEWCEHVNDHPYDKDGELALAGNANAALLDRWLTHPFFGQPAPKSTGREVFTLARMTPDPRSLAMPPADVAATLVALTAESIARALASLSKSEARCDEVIAMGGGVKNPALMQALRSTLGGTHLSCAEDHGWQSGLIEAGAFAWLAARRIDGNAGNLASVTGARGDRQLGAIYG